MSEMQGKNQMKHSYGGRACMACGGKACQISYEQLRDMVEKRHLGDFGQKMAKGGTIAEAEDALTVKGIHAGVPTRDTAGTEKSHAISWAGHGIREGHRREHNPGTSKVAKEEHKRVLNEMKTMSKPHGHYADGGSVPEPNKKNAAEMQKGATESKPKDFSYIQNLKEGLGMSESQAANKAKGGMMYADGGPVPSSSPSPGPVSKSGWDSFQSGFNKAVGSSPASASDQKKAHGGEIDSDGDFDGDSDDDMLMDQCAHECMEALKKGDKMAFKDSIQALVADCMRKMSEE